MPKINKAKPKSIISEVLDRKHDESVKDSKRISNFKISFQYLDSSQKYASSLKDWQSCGLLSCAIETLRGFCSKPLLDSLDGDKFTIYGGFPSEKNTLYIKPAHVPDDANWARIHVNGPSVIVGHVVNDTFYVVFLDKTHKFWLTQKDKEKYKNNKRK